LAWQFGWTRYPPVRWIVDAYLLVVAGVLLTTGTLGEARVSA